MKQSVPWFIAGITLLSGCSSDMKNNSSMTGHTPSGLRYEIVRRAPQGAVQPQRGQQVIVHYTGWLEENGMRGKKFDSSIDRGMPFSFVLGAGRVIRGWDEGVALMKVGEKRILIIPASLGYGERGFPGAIPGGATLIFEVELLGVE